MDQDSPDSTPYSDPSPPQDPTARDFESASNFESPSDSPPSPEEGSGHEPTTPLGATPSREERQWAMFAHLSALAGGLVSSWVGGLGVFIGPLVIWLMKREEMPFVDDQGKEALNFNITFGALALILVLLGLLTLGIGFIITLPLLAIAGIAWLVLTIIAAIRANEGQTYRYPISIRLIK